MPIELSTILSDLPDDTKAWVLQEVEVARYVIVPDDRYVILAGARFAFFSGAKMPMLSSTSCSVLIQSCVRRGSRR